MKPKEFFDAIENLDGTQYSIKVTNKFSRSISLAYRRNLDLELLKDIVHTLAKGELLDRKYRPHALRGYGMPLCECQIKPDWLLLWQQSDEQLVLILIDTGTHSDLF